jgi:hypothetical protein
MKKNVWTAKVDYRGGVIAAQDKSSLHVLTKRLLADDPIWSLRNVSYSKEKCLTRNILIVDWQFCFCVRSS